MPGIDLPLHRLAPVNQAPLGIRVSVGGEFHLLVLEVGAVSAGAARHAGRGPAREAQMQVAEDLVTAEGHVGPAAKTRAPALAGEVPVDQRLGLDVLSLQQQAPDLRQRLVGIRTVGILR